MRSKRSKLVSDDEIRVALIYSYGLISTAARLLGMLTRDLRERLTANPELLNVLQDADATIAGLAEFHWINNMRTGKGVISFLKYAGFPFEATKPELVGRLTEQEYERYRLTGKLPAVGSRRRRS